MSDSFNINWSTSQGRAELQRISNKLNISLPHSYTEQKTWAIDVVVKLKGEYAFQTTSSEAFSRELAGGTDSRRDISLSIGPLPSYIPQYEKKRDVLSAAIARFDLNDVKVVALFNLGFVFFDSKNRVLEEISSQYYPLLALHSNINQLLSSCVHHENTSTFIADWFFERNYAHWLLDTIPRLLKREGKVVCHKPEKAWQKELLALYGVTTKDIVPIEPNSCFSFERLLLDGKNSSPVPHPSYKCHTDAIKFIRSPIGSIVEAQSDSKVALVIKRFDSRVIVNSLQVEELLIQLGYVVQIIDCAEVAVATQMRCFAQADVVLGAHGAAMANTSFCKPSAIVVEVFPPCYGNPAFWAVSNSVGVKYVAVTDTEEVADDEKKARYRNIKLQESCFPLLKKILTSE